MRVLFLAPEVFYSPGGIQTYNQQLVNALRDLGYNLKVVSLNDAVRFSLKGYFFVGAGRFKFLKKILFILYALKETIFFKPVLIISAHINFSLCCAFINRFFKIPFFTVIYGIELEKTKWLNKLAVKSAKKIISISNFTKEKFLALFPPVKREDVFIIYPFVDVNKFRPHTKDLSLLQRLGLAPSDKIILTVARLSKEEKYKGYDRVILAISGIIEELPQIRYIIGGGGDKEEIERIKVLVKEKGLKQKVILTGFIPAQELVNYYNLCDCFVMPSEREGFGMVFLEALACGKPVIAGNKDGSQEALKAGKLGLLVDPKDIFQLRQAITSIFKKEIDNRLLDGDFLRKAVVENFSREYFYKKVKELLEGMSN